MKYRYPLICFKKKKKTCLSPYKLYSTFPISSLSNSQMRTTYCRNLSWLRTSQANSCIAMLTALSHNLLLLYSAPLPPHHWKFQLRYSGPTGPDDSQRHLLHSHLRWSATIQPMRFGQPLRHYLPPSHKLESSNSCINLPPSRRGSRPSLTTAVLQGENTLRHHGRRSSL